MKKIFLILTVLLIALSGISQNSISYKRVVIFDSVFVHNMWALGILDDTANINNGTQKYIPDIKLIEQLKAKINSISGGVSPVISRSLDSVFVNGVFAYRDSVNWSIFRSVPAPTSAINIRNDAGSFAVLPDKSWMVAYTAFNTASADAATCVIVVKRSFDRGANWVNYDTIVHNTNGQFNGIPSLWVQSNGTVLVLYDRQLSPTTSQIYKVTIAPPYTVGSASVPSFVYGSGSEYYSPGGDRIMKSKNGTLFYPLSINVNTGSNTDLGSQTGAYITKSLISLNDGNSWHLCNSMNFTSPDSLFVESGAYQKDDSLNTIVFYGRTRSNDVYSYDNPVVLNGNDTTFTSFGRWMNLHAPNSTTTIKYNPLLKVSVAMHNIGNSIGNVRGQMMISVSHDDHSWTPIYRLDSNSVIKYFEPFFSFIGSELVGFYSRENPAGADTSDMVMVRVPEPYIQNSAPFNNTYNNLNISKTDPDRNPTFINMYMPYANGFWRFDNASGLNTLATPWQKSKSNSANYKYLQSIDGVSTNSSANYQMNFLTNGGSVAVTEKLLELQNNGSALFSIYGDGRVNLGMIAGDATSPQNGQFWYNTTLNKFRARENGATVDMIGGTGGGISGLTTNFIPVASSSTSIGNSTASYDPANLLFNFPALATGDLAGTSGGWHFQVGSASVGGTFIQFRNTGNSANGNIFRADKTVLGSHVIPNGTGTLDFQANTVAFLRLAADGNGDAGDGYTNHDLLFGGRNGLGTITERFRVTSNGVASLSTETDGSTTVDLFKVNWKTQPTTFWKISNITAGPSLFSPWIRVFATGGYGILHDIKTSGTSGVFIIDGATTGGASWSSSTELLGLYNNGSKKFGVTAGGQVVVKDTASFEKVASYASNLHSQYTQYTHVDKSYLDSVVNILNSNIANKEMIVLFDTNADVGNTSTSESDLNSYVVPANRLALDGEKLFFHFSGTIVGSTSLKQLKLYFAGNSFFASPAMTVTGSTASWDLNGWVIRSSSTQLRTVATLNLYNGTTQTYTGIGEIGTLNFATTNIMKLTGQASSTGAATNDIISTQSTIEWKKTVIAN